MLEIFSRGRVLGIKSRASCILMTHSITQLQYRKNPPFLIFLICISLMALNIFVYFTFLLAVVNAYYFCLVVTCLHKFEIINVIMSYYSMVRITVACLKLLSMLFILFLQFSCDRLFLIFSIGNHKQKCP
jgi:hypothetical protein